METIKKKYIKPEIFIYSIEYNLLSSSVEDSNKCPYCGHPLNNGHKMSNPNCEYFDYGI